MTDQEIIQGIQGPGKFDVQVASQAEALRLIRAALPHAMGLPPPQPGQPYSKPPKGTKAWFQVHPPEPSVGNNMPHVKYVDWSAGKRGRGGSWGHLFFAQSKP